MQDEKNINQPKEITWQAPEYQEYKKHPLWFMAFGLITALLVLFGIYSGSWTTAITFALFGIVGLIYASQKPKTVTIKLTGTGVQAHNMMYDYRTVKKFWIVYHPPVTKCLYLETNAYLNSVIKIELANQDPRAVKTFLSRYVEEDVDGMENIVDVIARKVKF
ncbi:MAG TPA: hypothetical protein VEC17_01790 [Candidatus Binatia bacterium]|nr:hypothetical protein [Candidatus Binatia bacterium]